MLAAEKSKDTFIAPIGIGLALFIVEIAGIYYTGASVNPARSFGPCVVGANFQTYHWIYWLGPVLGACLAAGYYHFVKLFNYEDANPGQDSSGGGFDAQVERAESGTLDDMEAAKGSSGGGGQSSERGQAQGGYGQTSDRGQAQGGYGQGHGQGYGHDYGRENGPNNTSYYNEQGRPTSRSQAPRLPEMNTVQGMTDRY